jgi:hypothetical protein
LLSSIREFDLRSKFLSAGCYPGRSLLRAVEKAKKGAAFIRDDGRDLKMFEEWFDIEIHTTVLDTVGGEILHDASPQGHK